MTDTTGVHGMLLFGSDVLYLSHLPMFMSPHNFQVLLEAGFDDAVLEVLRADRAAGGEAGGIHTFEPEVFPIVELDPSGDGPARTAIEGTVYHGHFERGGTPIAERVTAEVRSVVHFAEFDIQAQRPTDLTLTYLCFGRAGRLHLVHRITASPDFDHVIEARLVPGSLTDPAGRPLRVARARKDTEVRDAATAFGRAQKAACKALADTLADFAVVIAQADQPAPVRRTSASRRSSGPDRRVGRPARVPPRARDRRCPARVRRPRHRTDGAGHRGLHRARAPSVRHRHRHALRQPARARSTRPSGTGTR